VRKETISKEAIDPDKKGMTTTHETKFLPMNHHTMCHARVWCRETGQAGGQGGYEKACPLKMTGDHLCAFHHKKGIQMGLITEERPSTWGEESNMVPHGKKAGGEIKWKCSPPNYDLTHGDHKYKIRDETVGKDLLRDKLNKKFQAMEKQLEVWQKRVKVAEEKQETAEQTLKHFTREHYEMEYHFHQKRDGNGGWTPAKADDPEVVEDFKALKKNINILHRGVAPAAELRKIVRDNPMLGNEGCNEIFWETFKNPGDFVKTAKTFVPLDVEEILAPVDISNDIREMLFDISNKAVEQGIQNEEAAIDLACQQAMDGMVSYLEGVDFTEKVMENPRATLKYRNDRNAKTYLKHKYDNKSEEYARGCESIIKTLPMKKKAVKKKVTKKELNKSE
tara:strand:- start:8408 stop:9586 length:1179 start_codon:yes stop_codon:yes gene_type:complete